MKLTDVLLITGEIKLLTGLHIGAGNDEIRIGGRDNPVIRDPVTKRPYIPGSSIKGKMRMLMELYFGKMDEEGRPYQKWDDEEGKYICKLFGVSGSEDIPKGIAPARLSFYDLRLLNADDLEKKVGALLTEDKAEVMVNRLSGTGQHPRHTERVPAGAIFEFKLAVKVFDNEEEELLDLVKKGLKLLQLDSLGGSGSRGYGKFRFRKLEVKSLFTNEKKGNIDLDTVTL